MDTKCFECAICFELCRQCTNCTKCNQILCLTHVAQICESGGNRCPMCRDEPFHFQENIALQRIIADLRERMGLVDPEPEAPPPASAAAAPGAGTPAEEQAPPRRLRRRVQVSERTAQSIEANAVPADPACGDKLPCPQRPGHFMKVPNEDHDRAMAAHVGICTHSDCHSVWRGPWGNFIGGTRGSRHFDLTRCALGRHLNESIGWNYDEPHK